MPEEIGEVGYDMLLVHWEYLACTSVIQSVIHACELLKHTKCSNITKTHTTDKACNIEELFKYSKGCFWELINNNHLFQT